MHNLRLWAACRRAWRSGRSRKGIAFPEGTSIYSVGWALCLVMVLLKGAIISLVFTEIVIWNAVVTTEELARGVAMLLQGAACEICRGARVCADGNGGGSSGCLDGERDERCKYDQ